MRTKRYSIIIFSIAVILIMITSQFTIKKTIYSISPTENYPFGEIVPNKMLIQEINIDTDLHVDNIDIKLATYARNNNNNNNIRIYKNEDNIYNQQINSAYIKDNGYYNIGKVDSSFKKGDKLYIVIQSLDGKKGNAITGWISRDVEKGKLQAYDYDTGVYTDLEGTLIIKLNHDIGLYRYLSGKYFNLPIWIIIIILFIIFYLIFRSIYELIKEVIQ